jgi:hypothetical protein
VREAAALMSKPHTDLIKGRTLRVSEKPAAMRKIKQA